MKSEVVKCCGSSLLRAYSKIGIIVLQAHLGDFLFHVGQGNQIKDVSGRNIFHPGKTQVLLAGNHKSGKKDLSG